MFDIYEMFVEITKFLPTKDKLIFGFVSKRFRNWLPNQYENFVILILVIFYRLKVLFIFI